MDSIQLPIENESVGKGKLGGLFQGIVSRKLSHPLVIGFVSLVALIICGLLAFAGPKPALLLVIGVAALPIVYGIITQPRFGIMIILISAYFIMWILRMGAGFPMGTVMDAIQALLFFGLLLKLKYRKDWSTFRSPVSIMILVWIGYNLLEIANPAAESRLSWLYTLRSVAIVMLMYFIFFYNIRSVKFIKQIFIVWIALSAFAAAYGYYQEFFGYLPFEQRWVDSDPMIEELYFIAGHWRKFSIFSDPVAFAYNMVASALLCFCLAMGPLRLWKKTILFSLSVFFIGSMLFSGTRGAYVLLPAALGLYSIIKFNKRVIVFAAIAAVFIGFLIVVPTGNPTLMRFQSAFKPSEDASFNLRKMNQKRIQPYILSHPMGGGLGATGVWGQRFAPGSYLANFPPDSGYVRVAVELGWLGLLLFCTLMFIILRTGINNYYAMRDPQLKSYAMAMLLIVFAMNIGNYPQEALVQFPSSVYFYLEIALLNVLPIIEKQRNGSLPAAA